MRYDVRCEKCGEEFEIEKPMKAAWPKCPKCKGQIRRLFTKSPPVHFAAAGFYSTDVTHFEKVVGKERAEKFRKRREDVETRAKEGKLTPYERHMEELEKNAVQT